MELVESVELAELVEWTELAEQAYLVSIFSGVDRGGIIGEVDSQSI